MKTWEKVLQNEIQDSDTIRAETEKLKSSGQEMENDLPGLKRTLEKARQDLLAESVGASDRVKEAEEAISESKNKILAISGIIKELDVALEKALTSETIKKQAEISQAIAAVDDDVSKLHQEALMYFSKAAVIINKLQGNEREDRNLSYSLFQRWNLSTELNHQIAAGTADQEGPSLHTRREQLSRQGEQLSKQG